VGDAITASKINEVRDALDQLSAKQNQCSSGGSCCIVRYYTFAAEESVCKASKYRDDDGVCHKGHCAQCDDGSWAYIICSDDPVYDGVCLPDIEASVCIWPSCAGISI